MFSLKNLPASASVDDVLAFLNDCGVHGVKTDEISLSSRAATVSPHLARISLDDVGGLSPGGLEVLQRRLDGVEMGGEEIQFVAARAERKPRQRERNRVRDRDGRKDRDKRSGDGDAHQDLQEGPAVMLVRGLPFKIKAHQLIAHFRDAGHVPLSVKLLKGDDGRPNGQAWIQFESEQQAEQAGLQMNKSTVSERYIDCGPSVGRLRHYDSSSDDDSFRFKERPTQWELREMAREAYLDYRYGS